MDRKARPSFGMKLLCLLLAGVILAACSACGKKVQETEASTTAAELPSIGVPGNPTISSTEESGTADPEGSAASSVAESGTAEETAETTGASERPPIRVLQQSEIDEIRERYDSKVHGFGTGFRSEWVDANNRPTMVNNLLSHFAGSEADILAYCSDANTRCVAFSFQCGTEYGHTSAVLDILEQYKVESTFYIIHSYAAKNRGLVERMIGDGHVVGSHTYSCPNGGIANWPLEDQMEDALKMQQYMQASFGYTMHKFNFNSGYWSEQAIILMSRMGYQVDFCSCNYSDYDPNAVFDAEALLADLEASLHPGCIYCFHTTNVITPTILGPLIEYCLAQGYRIVQVP